LKQAQNVELDELFSLDCDKKIYGKMDNPIISSALFSTIRKKINMPIKITRYKRDIHFGLATYGHVSSASIMKPIRASMKKIS
jgi:hypothetical protein